MQLCTAFLNLGLVVYCNPDRNMDTRVRELAAVYAAKLPNDHRHLMNHVVNSSHPGAFVKLALSYADNED